MDLEIKSGYREANWERGPSYFPTGMMVAYTRLETVVIHLRLDGRLHVSDKEEQSVTSKVSHVKNRMGGWHCSTVGYTTASNMGIPRGCQFKSPLLHF